MNFILWIAFIGIFIAMLQDLKRREVDRWLNFLIFTSSFAYVALYSIFNNNLNFFFLAIVSMIVMLLISNLFYYGRIFGGGDADLLFAMFAVFIASSFLTTITNILIFIFFMLISGSVVGIISGIYLFFNNFKKTSRDFLRIIKTGLMIFLLIFSVIVFFLGFLYSILFLIGLLFILYVILYAFSKSVENVSMIKSIDSEKLRPGDWLFEAVKFKGKTIKPYWEGLTEKQVSFLKNYKKKIKVKDGLAFVPAILIAFIMWIFRENIINFILRFFN